jgi:copper chaperone CopZ
MKSKILYPFILVFCLTVQVSFAQEIASEQTIIESLKTTTATIGIEGMACQEGCADKIASNLRETEGIVSADVSYENKNGIVFFDPTLISITEIKSIITNTKVKDYNYTISSVNLQEN